MSGNPIDDLSGLGSYIILAITIDSPVLTSLNGISSVEYLRSGGDVYSGGDVDFSGLTALVDYSGLSNVVAVENRDANPVNINLPDNSAEPGFVPIPSAAWLCQAGQSGRFSGASQASVCE